MALWVSCSTLNSTTFIKPNDSFILGDNEHGAFKVRLQNVSASSIEVYQTSRADGKKSVQIVQPNEGATVQVAPNTALVIQNSSNDPASVQLKVTGDVQLSMDYKN
jgi:hypothetical protein